MHLSCGQFVGAQREVCNGAWTDIDKAIFCSVDLAVVRQVCLTFVVAFCCLADSGSNAAQQTH